jgi:hypothetical protein
MLNLKLFAPDSYYELGEATKATICSGCGTTGWKGKLVPDDIWGVNITEACQIHDYMYFIGETIEDKYSADRVFLNNMIRLINNKGGWFAWFRRYRAVTYYNAVAHFGGPAYWDGKNDKTYT